MATKERNATRNSASPIASSLQWLTIKSLKSRQRNASVSPDNAPTASSPTRTEYREKCIHSKLANSHAT